MMPRIEPCGTSSEMPRTALISRTLRPPVPPLRPNWVSVCRIVLARGSTMVRYVMCTSCTLIAYLWSRSSSASGGAARSVTVATAAVFVSTGAASVFTVSVFTASSCVGMLSEADRELTFPPDEDEGAEEERAHGPGEALQHPGGGRGLVVDQRVAPGA